MQYLEEFMQIANEVVNNCNYSFLTKKDIINNFKDLGFLVNENTMIGYTSYLEYDKETNTGLISYTKDVPEKRQQKILLVNFAAFILSKEKHLKFYYKSIPHISKVKKFTRCLTEISVNKEFPIENDLCDNIEYQKRRK